MRLTANSKKKLMPTKKTANKIGLLGSKLYLTERSKMLCSIWGDLKKKRQKLVINNKVLKTGVKAELNAEVTKPFLSFFFTKYEMIPIKKPVRILGTKQVITRPMVEASINKGPEASMPVKPCMREIKPHVKPRTVPIIGPKSPAPIAKGRPSKVQVNGPICKVPKGVKPIRNIKAISRAVIDI